MNVNETLITRFYNGFQKKDFKAMQGCYHADATFSDEVFTDLNAARVKAMWEMLITNGKDLRLEFTNVKANDTHGSADWIAYYTFSRSGHKVVNRIKAEFVFKDGQIIQHTDRFSFYAWARQALGLPGILLGWTPFMKRKIRNMAIKNLEGFMARQISN